MTVSTIGSVAEFDTNGVTTNYPFYFKFLANEDLVVTYVNPAGVSSVLTLGTNYTVNGAGNEQGGSIVTTTALAGPGQLIVSREMDPFQQTSLRNQGKFLAETHEDVFDRLTMLIQQGFAIFKRALTRPFGRDYFFAENRRIASVKDPVEDQDAATRGWATRYFGDLIDGASGNVNTTTGILYDSGTLYDYLKSGLFRVVDTHAQLLLLNPSRNVRAFALGYYSVGDGGGGAYYYNGSEWSLVNRTSLNPIQFGAKHDGSDDTIAISNMISSLLPGGKLDGLGYEYTVTNCYFNSFSWIDNFRFKTLGGSNDMVTPFTIDGRTVSKQDIKVTRVYVDGNRANQSLVKMQTASEDGGRHCFRLIGRMKNISFDQISGNNSAGDGMIIYSSTSPTGNDLDFVFENISVSNFELNGNRRHGASQDSIKRLRFKKGKMTGNGLDLNTTQPLNHGSRGDRFNGLLYGNANDLEGYGVGHSVLDIQFEDVDMRGNAKGSVLQVDNTDQNAPTFSPRGDIWYIRCKLDNGVSVNKDDFAVSITCSIENTAKAPLYSKVRIIDCETSGKILLRSVANPEVFGGYINAPLGIGGFALLDHVVDAAFDTRLITESTLYSDASTYVIGRGPQFLKVDPSVVRSSGPGTFTTLYTGKIASDESRALTYMIQGTWAGTGSGRAVMSVNLTGSAVVKESSIVYVTDQISGAPVVAAFNYFDGTVVFDVTGSIGYTVQIVLKVRV